MNILDMSENQQQQFYAAISIIKKIAIENQEPIISTFLNDKDGLISIRIHFEGLTNETKNRNNPVCPDGQESP